MCWDLDSATYRLEVLGCFCIDRLRVGDDRAGIKRLLDDPNNVRQR